MSPPPSTDLHVPAPASAPDLSPLVMRGALGRFATGVTIVTCIDAAGVPVGLTANSFTSLSLDPPLVLWSLRRSSASVAAFDGATHFAINVLAETQVDLSRRFASPVADKFEHGHWRAGLGQAPLLAGCAAVFECGLHLRQEAGDHVLYIGRVLRLQDQAVAPLLFQGGHYHLLGEVL